MQELCGKGGILFLAQAILKLNVMPHFIESPRVVAYISRLKARVLSIVSLVIYLIILSRGSSFYRIY